ncbi:MAG: iron ABC transporter permease [Rhodoferax sp.]|nr:iron ABC transporter permease [Rhodoferax sp.]
MRRPADSPSPDRALWLGLLPLGLLALLVVAPLLRLLWQGWGGPGLESGTGLPAPSPWAVLQDDYLRWRLVWSLAQALATCVAASLLGLPLAWVLARLEFPGRAAALRLLMLPFVVPTLVAAIGVMGMWGAQGWLGGLTGLDLQGTPALLLLGNLFFNLCLVVRAGAEALERVDARQLAAARTLGATPWRAFWRIEWPTIAPALAASLCLVFLYCFSGFGLALVLGGQRHATVEVEIYRLVAHELRLGEAGALAAVAVLVTGAAACAHAVLAHRLAVPLRVEPVPRRRPRGGLAWLALLATASVLLVCCALPLFTLLAQALLAGPAAWAVLLEPETLSALWNTLRFSGVALVLATLLGLLHALSARRRVLWRAASFLPFVVSPVSVAFGLLLLLPAWTASLWLLLGAYAVLAYPFVAQSVAAGLDSQPASLAQAARTLGATPWRSFWRVTLPLLRPALRRGMAFAAATAVGEFAVTLFLSRPEWATLSTLVYERLGRPGAANRDAAIVLSGLLVGLALLVFWLIERPGRDSAVAVAGELRHG